VRVLDSENNEVAVTYGDLIVFKLVIFNRYL
jgi:hypothetical protein